MLLHNWHFISVGSAVKCFTGCYASFICCKPLWEQWFLVLRWYKGVQDTLTLQIIQGSKRAAKNWMSGTWRNLHCLETSSNSNKYCCWRQRLFWTIVDNNNVDIFRPFCNQRDYVLTHLQKLACVFQATFWNETDSTFQGNGEQFNETSFYYCHRHRDPLKPTRCFKLTRFARIQNFHETDNIYSSNGQRMLVTSRGRPNIMYMTYSRHVPHNTCPSDIIFKV